MKAHHFLLSILLLFSLSGVIHAETYTQAMKKAQKGDAYSQSQLGHILANGKGVREDDKAAVKWFRLAAEQGDAYGQSSLGWAYSKGEGVPKDKTEAVKWFRLAAEQGDAYGQSSLGWAYSNGEGVPKDKTEAVKWFRLAAEQGDAYGQSSLAAMYAEESEDRWGCASQAGQAKTEYAAQQIEKTCLVKRGYKPEPKGWFDW